MQPFVHARASAANSGRPWQEDLPIHEFMDLAKHACPDLRHRLVLHNADLGPGLAALAFPQRANAKDVARFHVQQDLGWLPPLSAWLNRCEPEKLPRSRKTPMTGDELVSAAVDHLGLTDATPAQNVWDMLDLPSRVAPNYAGVSSLLLMNSVGPILARATFGPPRPVRRKDGRDTIVDFGWIAEGMIVARVGAIHSLERVLACFDGREPDKSDTLKG